MTNLDDMRRRRPGNRTRIDAIKAEMDREVAHYRLRELREAAGYTQTTLAAAIGVGQNRVSQMEHGDLGTSRVDTLRKYVEATGVSWKCPSSVRTGHGFSSVCKARRPRPRAKASRTVSRYRLRLVILGCPRRSEAVE